MARLGETTKLGELRSVSFDKIMVRGSELRLPRAEDFDRCEAAMGIRLPASYKAFCFRFGYGLLAEIFLVYTPDFGECDSLENRSRDIRATMAHCLEIEIAEFEPDGSPELFARLCPFGISENGDTLTWDPLSAGPDQELDVYVLGSKMLSVARAGRTMADFIESVTGPRVKRLLGPGYDPLAPTFVPRLGRP